MDLETQLAVHERRFALHEKRHDRIDKRLDAPNPADRYDRKRQKEAWEQHRQWSKDVEFHIDAQVAYGREQQKRIDQIINSLRTRADFSHKLMGAWRGARTRACRVDIPVDAAL